MMQQYVDMLSNACRSNVAVLRLKEWGTCRRSIHTG